MMSANEALERLKAGNKRYVSDAQQSNISTSQARRDELKEGQAPFAIILGCSDSRAPVEIIFDEGLGELFVIRVAGNVVAASQLGSIEYAAEVFGTRLVVVLGHTKCGAVTATLEELQQPTDQQSPNLRSIVSRIQPAVASLLETDLSKDKDALLLASVRSNARISANNIRYGSDVLENLIASDGLKVVSAIYSLETGEVEFFDT